jgi:hypothetical protein
MNTRIASFVLSLVAIVAVSACGSSSGPITPPGPKDIAFDLTIVPGIISPGDYHAISGTSIISESQIIGDSLFDVSGHAFYAQFYKSSPADSSPTMVTLNNNPLERHLGGDTFRLASGDPRTLGGSNIWRLHSGGDSTAFTTAAMDPIDTVSPLVRNTVVRGDIDLQLVWPLSPTGANGMKVIWTGGSLATPIIFSAQDNGRLTIPKSEMVKLVGARTVLFIRFRNQEYTYNGKKLIVTRLAQRSYEVTVEP